MWSDALHIIDRLGVEMPERCLMKLGVCCPLRWVAVVFCWGVGHLGACVAATAY